MKFQELFKLMEERKKDLEDLLKYEVEWGYLGNKERSALEDLMGMCQDFDSLLEEVLEKRSPEYRKVHGIK